MSRTCHRCGSPVAQGRDVCANCGAAVGHTDAIIRCRHCHRRAPSYLSLCPHCGRKLAPWRPDRALALIAIAIVLFAWLVLGGGWRTVDRAGSAIVALLPDPPTQTPTPQPLPTLEQPALDVATATVESLIIPTPTPTATPLPATATPTATATPEATATPTPGPEVYVVQPGDTPIGIAERFGISVAELLSFNNISDPTSLRINQELRIPPQTTDTPTPEPTATATVSPTETMTSTATVAATNTATATSPPPANPTGTVRPSRTPTATATATTAATATPRQGTYVVQVGDTPIAIANRFGITVQALLAFNNIANPTSLRVNQELRIPPVDYVPPTPTPRPPTATPTTAPTATPSITLDAPVLGDPADGAAFKGANALIVLTWQNPGGLPDGVDNVIQIGVLVGTNTVDWRLTEAVGRDTQYRVPSWLFNQAPQEFGRTYLWTVQAASVTLENGQIIDQSPRSPASERRRFNWN